MTAKCQSYDSENAGTKNTGIVNQLDPSAGSAAQKRTDTRPRDGWSHFIGAEEQAQIIRELRDFPNPNLIAKAHGRTPKTIMAIADRINVECIVISRENYSKVTDRLIAGKTVGSIVSELGIYTTIVQKVERREQKAIAAAQSAQECWKKSLPLKKVSAVKTPPMKQESQKKKRQSRKEIERNGILGLLEMANVKAHRDDRCDANRKFTQPEPS